MGLFLENSMVRKKIMAHFMHENERDAARNIMSQVQETQSYLLGEIEEGDIPQLKKQGLIVQPIDDQPVSETPGLGTSLRSRIREMPSEGFESDRALEGEERGLLDTEKPNFYLVKLRGPLLENWRAALSEKDVLLLEYVHPNGYTAKLSPEQAVAVSKLPFVSFIRLYDAKDTGPIELRSALVPSPPSTSPRSAEKKMVTYDLRVHQEEDLTKVTQWLQQHGVGIAGSKGRKIRLYLIEGSSLVESIVALPEVAVFEEFVPPKLDNDVARVLIGIDSGQNPSVSSHISQKGEGQIIGVADSGIDKDHPDFKGKISGIVALGRPGDSSDFHGHGSHVAGSIAGNGASSQGLIRGMAPEAGIFFQSIMDAEGGLRGLPLNLGDLYEQAYQAGARVHNNSWSANTNSFYTINSLEVDEFVANRRDMLVIFAAGNEGHSNNVRNVQKGYVDWLSIGSPPSCKNCLTVGASRSNRTSGGYSRLKYGDVWRTDFPDSPIAEELVSGNPECLAAFGSRGPCDDRRIKPDLVAPGTDIASVKSSIAPLRNYWGAYPGNPKYGFMGGTSMSAPIVAGCAALVRQYYIEERNHEPSAALLKATLINGTRWLTGPDAVAEFNVAPNFHQGFGGIYMPQTIPNNTAEPNLRLEFVDTWKNQESHFNMTGQRFRFTVRTNGGKWLRICLVWTDLPARALQNNLDLFVEHLSSAQKWLGNQDRPMSLNIPDPDNNVEVVRLQNPAPGEYLIQVQATNLLKKGQDFALVAAGDLSSPLAPIP